MLNIGDLFKKITSKYAQEIFLRKTVADAINFHTKTNFKDKDIKIDSTIVTLMNASSSAKSAIYIKKSKILDDINKNQTVRKITDIK
jgi:hypothetical protein